ncbi:Hpt domain-containing protein [Phyllobacterium bourgognense]|uniref:Hpt domain-containing protein n=1 Tax=Phyllobacterium bourgognense TaxID=314236 RepID=A0A368YQI8_9HYPH|nr:Hpt domain-containing protein [Phyllobacterium bourgognense]RCW81536.1 Hpt domain-containing protein [Phyllobacterium bourgognense]
MEDKLGQLRRRFLERCKANLPVLQAGHSLLDDATGDEQKDFLALVHSLAGAGGMFGFQEISNAAIELETVLRDEDGPIDVVAAHALLRRLVTATCAALQDVEKS